MADDKLIVAATFNDQQETPRHVAPQAGFPASLRRRPNRGAAEAMHSAVSAFLKG